MANSRQIAKEEDRVAGSRSSALGSAQRFKEFTQGAELIMKSKQSQLTLQAPGASGNATATSAQVLPSAGGGSKKLKVSQKFSQIVKIPMNNNKAIS